MYKNNGSKYLVASKVGYLKRRERERERKEQRRKEERREKKRERDCKTSLATKSRHMVYISYT